jgi:hypothetical protein
MFETIQVWCEMQKLKFQKKSHITCKFCMGVKLGPSVKEDSRVLAGTNFKELQYALQL